MILSSEEAKGISLRSAEEECLEFFAARCPSTTVVVTLGPRGSALISGGRVTPIPAFRCDKVVDPTGAGDAFAAGFVAGLMKGEGDVEAAGRGSEWGARCCGVLGGCGRLFRR